MPGIDSAALASAEVQPPEPTTEPDTASPAATEAENAPEETVAPEAAPEPATEAALAVAAPPLLDPAGAPAEASVSARSHTSEVAEGYEEIKWSDAAKRIGAKVRIFDQDGRLHAGVLKAVEHGAVIVTFDVGAGSLVAGFEQKEIRSLQVAR